MRPRKLFASVLIAFLLVAGIGAITSYLAYSPKATTGSGDTLSYWANDETLVRLKDYTRSIESKKPLSRAASRELLPDVNTMIEQLAARLETAPGDIKGWRMLGWSYFHTGRYEQAAAAYARAVELDPNSTALKTSYAEAKAKAANTDSSSQTEAVRNGGDEVHVAKKTESEATPAPGHDTAIRAMVDGLANRLKSSPRDVEGWTRLMRSRVVLGEREVATVAFREAREVFKDDPAATGKLTSAAIELGLKAE
jgi:cytochrome c-type biogenesis protein CcmH